MRITGGDLKASALLSSRTRGSTFVRESEAFSNNQMTRFYQLLNWA
jgi:hypothetical protein